MRTVMMRYPDGKAKAVTFSYDDGKPQDVRLAALFDQYGMKGTFNFNSDRHRKDIFTKEQFFSFIQMVTLAHCGEVFPTKP